MRLNLSDVTIAAADGFLPQVAGWAIERSKALCDFGDAVLLTDADVSGNFRTVRTPPIKSKQAYSHFILKELVHHVHTPYVLVVQWDGFVVDPTMWRDEYRNFDYIGARFDRQDIGVDVGNGGFSLRSAKLLRAVVSADFTIPDECAEDLLICRDNRDLLESKHGIRIAPIALAEQFSYEWVPAPGATFGFHGFSHFWRHLTDDEMIALADQLPTSVLTSRLFITMLVHYYAQQRYKTWKTLYRKMRPLTTRDFIARNLASIIKHPQQAGPAALAWDQAIGYTE